MRQIARDAARSRAQKCTTMPEVFEEKGDPMYDPRRNETQPEYDGLYPNSRVAKPKFERNNPRKDWKINISPEMQAKIDRLERNKQMRIQARRVADEIDNGEISPVVYHEAPSARPVVPLSEVEQERYDKWRADHRQSFADFMKREREAMRDREKAKMTRMFNAFPDLSPYA